MFMFSTVMTVSLVTVSLCLGTSGSFVADRIELNTNTSTVVVENGFVADALIYVRFPAGEFSAIVG